MSDPRVIGLPQILGALAKLVVVALFVAMPLTAVWVASSLAALSNQSTTNVVLAGLLLFPVLPVAWEIFAAWRRGGRATAPRTSRLFDRLLLRTIAISLLFLGGLLATRPERAFMALSTRGDWMLTGRYGRWVKPTREALFASARGLEWLYEAAHDNPYRESKKKKGESPSPSPSSSPITMSPAWPMKSELHPAVRDMPPEARRDIESVGRYLARAESDAFLRVKALHDFVVQHVAYDVEALAQPAASEARQRAADPVQVFANKKGICAGYAHLMEALARVTGDEIQYITGDARSSTGISPHAWNLAKIAGRYYLIDPTWDAGYVDGAGFHSRVSTAYLFVPPEVMGFTHYPDAEWHQLRSTTLDRGAFMRQQLLRPEFFAAGLTLTNLDRWQAEAKNPVAVTLKNPSGETVSLAYQPAGEHHGKHCGEIRNDGTISCAVPSAGLWDLSLFANGAYAGTIQVLVK